MPTLSLPTVDVHESFLAAMAEFVAEGRGGPDDDSMIAGELADFAGTWGSPAGFAAYVAAMRETEPRLERFVPSTTYWWVEGPQYLGRLAIRHRLNEGLLESGGHIGYDVRPSARRRGYATRMLREALPIARELGIDPALLTVETDNVASRRVIEANGGVLEDERGGKYRFWVPTGPAAS